MSTGAKFKLISNDGIQDKLLMSSDYLSERLQVMENLQKKNRFESNKTSKDDLLKLNSSWTPTIEMINKTHTMFVNGSYKPFVATVFEYTKILSSATFGNTTKFTLPNYSSDFINDIVVHIKINGLRSKSPEDRVRYVALLGHKLLSSVKFNINGNPIDEITSDDYNAFLEFQVPPEKRIGWLRNVGQEIPQSAYLTSDPTFDLYREYKFFGDGNQTYKQVADPVELWIPLIFWFNKINNAIPCKAIPFGQTDINITFASVSEIVGYADYGGGGAYIEPKIETCDLYVNNIYMNQEVSRIFMNQFGFSLIRVHCRHVEKLVLNNASIKLNKLKWPTECLYVAFKPYNNLSLSQYWHKNSILKQCNIKVPAVAKNKLILTNGIINATLPITNNSASLTRTGGIVLNLTNDFYNNYYFVITGGTGYFRDSISDNRYVVTGYDGATQTITINGVWNGGGMPNSTTTFELFTPQLAINVAQYYKEIPTISRLEVKSNDIVLFNESSESFYNSYLPYRYGTNMNTPEDRGWYMINFNFFPGEHQPSGHMNLSRTREFYINYKSNNNISQEKSVELIVLADAINFLVLKDNSAALQYAT